MKKTALVLLSIAFSINLQAADTTHILFIGNSYTGVNNLPQIVENMAEAGGHTLKVSSNTPGGTTFRQHLQNSTTLNLIKQGNWDYVILQGQSQTPAFPDNQVEQDFYPPAKALDSLIHAFNPCAKTVFYMTWGRQYGDQRNCQNFPPICTYEGMDSLLRLRYTNIADTVSAYISPAGPVWHYIRNHYSQVNLYQNDNSHPTQAGSFAVACAFYSVLFNENPVNNPYHYTIDSVLAETIKTAAKKVAYDSISYWRRFRPMVSSNYDFTVSEDTVAFSNLSSNTGSISGRIWKFGDGQTATTKNPIHVYAPGDYQACLINVQDCDSVVYCHSIHIEGGGNTGLSDITKNNEITVYPNPIHGNRLFLIKRTEQESFHYNIYNTLGALKQTGILNPHQRSIRIKNIPSGIYFLTLLAKDKTRSVIKFQKI